MPSFGSMVYKMKLFGVISLFFVFSSSTIIEINEELYNTTVTSDDKLWLLYFYAPWCHHCKKMAPVLENISTEFPTTLNIAKIDATQSKNLASQHEILSFPTIKFLYRGKYALYTGERKFDDLKSFILRFHGQYPLSSPLLLNLCSSDNDVKTVTSQQQLQEYLEQMKYLFVLSMDPSQKYHSEIRQFFIEIAEHMKMDANFLIHEERNEPLSIHKLELNRHALYLKLNDSNLMIEKKQIEEFVEKHNHLLVNSLDKTNMRRLGRTGKPLLIAIINGDGKDDRSAQLIESLDQAASSLEIEEAHSFIFGHMDGVKYRHYLERYRGASLSTLLVLDLSVNGYYVLKDVSEENVKDVVLKALTKSLPWIEVEPTNMGFFQKIQWKLQQYYPWSLLCLLPFLFLLLSSLFPHPNSKKQIKVS